jgi:hypothetical protein
MNGLLVGFGCFAVHAAISLAWLRVSRGPAPVVRHTLSAIGTHVAGVGSAAIACEPFSYWHAAAVSGFGAVCWLFAFSAVYKSVSLRILTQLARTPGHSLSFDVIATDYVRPEFQARCDVLVKMGCAAESNAGYLVTEKGKATARRIESVQRACGIESSGLYGNDTATAEAAATG